MIRAAGGGELRMAVSQQEPSRGAFERGVERSRFLRFARTTQDKTGQLQAVLFATAAIAITVPVYLLRVDDVVGQFKDDAWFVVLAKSLATGHGYNLINLPRPFSSYFPPVYPFLLSVLYRVSPEFPRNVVLLKALSVASMLLAALFVFHLFSREGRLPRLLAYWLALCTALAPSFVMLATSTLMSECVFTMLQFAALLLAERCADRAGKQNAIGSAVLAALIASAAYLTRSMGIFLLAAVPVVLGRRKMYKQAAFFVATALVIAGGWATYRELRFVPPPSSWPVMEGYSAQFWERRAGSPIPVTARDLPGRVWQVSTLLVAADTGALLVPSFYRSASESGEEVVETTEILPGLSRNPMHMYGGSMGLAASAQLVSAGLFALVFAGFAGAIKRDLGLLELVFGLSLLFLIVWPWPPIRLLVPLLPLFLYYLVRGMTSALQVLQRALPALRAVDAWSAARISLLCMLALFVYDNAAYVHARHAGPNSPQYPDWVRHFDSARQAAAWVGEHTAESEIVTGDNLPQLYLFSQRRTELCKFEECVNKGIRYYVNTRDVTVPIPARRAFGAGYHGVDVWDIRSAR